MCDLVENGGRFMKSKKAVTLLARAESLLSDVLDEYSVIEKQVEKNVRAVLLSAQDSVNSAMNFISALPTAAQIPSKSGRRRAKAKTKARPRARAKKTAARKRR
jgi:division protein CdvB (Snf7/Vps24/ESCRT-III family)